MAKRTGRGIAAIEYPTGMNQNGDPSQAWIKVKPDGRVDVFAGTSDIGNGSKTIQSQIVAETIGVPYDWVTYDNRTRTRPRSARAPSRHGRRSSPARPSRRRPSACERGSSTSRARSWRSTPPTSRSSTARCSPRCTAEEDRVPDVAAAATWAYGELITGTGAQLKPYAPIVDPETGEVDLPPHSAVSYAAVAAEVEVDDETGSVKVTRPRPGVRRRARDQPDAGRGTIEGGAVHGARARRAREPLPVLPVGGAPRRPVRAYLAPTRICRRSTRSTSRTRPRTARTGPRGSGRWRTTGSRPPSPPRYTTRSGWVTEPPITPEKVLRALEAKARARASETRKRMSCSTKACP